MLIACIVGWLVGKWLRSIDEAMNIDLTQLSDAELDARYYDEEATLEVKCAIMEEKRRRNPLPERPADSQFECEGCGS